MQLPNEENLALTKIFNPYFYKKYFSILNSGRRFVHYTSASAAKSMIENRSVWMRNVRLVNDYSEISYGRDLLYNSYKSGFRIRLKKAFEIFDENFCEEVENLFDGWSPEFSKSLYLASISEHRGALEDRFGRLSMWRSYGGQASVALVLNNSPFLSETDALSINTSPVLYADQSRFNKEFERFVVGVEENISHPLMTRAVARNRFYQALLMACICTKHPGFFEEREWRILFMKNYHESRGLETDIVDIRGVPQTVYKIPLREIRLSGAGLDFVGADIPNLIDRILIGPCDGAAIVRDTFIELLEKAGVAQADKKVVLSNIPLRNPI